MFLFDLTGMTVTLQQVQDVVLLDEEVEPNQPLLGDASDDGWFNFQKELLSLLHCVAFPFIPLVTKPLLPYWDCGLILLSVCLLQERG